MKKKGLTITLSIIGTLVALVLIIFAVTFFSGSEITLTQSHRIAKKVHDAIEGKFEKIKHITVCVNPLCTEGKK